jgi:hypothetical protein
MVPREPPTPDELREAIRDLQGILRGMYLAEREPTRRARVVAAGKRLVELDAVLDQPGTEAYERATRAADAAVDAVLGGLHFNASLAPVLGHAASRAILSRRR